MKIVITAIVALLLSFGIVSTVSANCADDAINTCNAKHPDSDKSDQAYDLYELCIKAQIGQNCPNSAAGNAAIGNLQSGRKDIPKTTPSRMKPDNR